MIKCLNCGRDNEVIFKYCLACGAELKGRAKTEQKPAPVVPPTRESSAKSMIDSTAHSYQAVPSDLLYEEEAKQTPAPFVQKEVMKEISRICKLQIIRPDGGIGREFLLNDGENTIGTEDAAITINDDGYLSRIHGIFEKKGDRVVFKDASGTNGSFIRIRTEIPIKNGDLFRMGQGLFKLEFLAHQQRNVPSGDIEIEGSPIIEGVYGRLMRIHDRHTLVSAHMLRGKETKIGRTKGDILFPEDPFISGSHALVTKRGNEVFLKDLGSSNGTYIKITREIVLEDNDSILMGQNLYRFKFQ
jgi:pSer/pThr/pTyr-binding forkhead associated (FHA) protein